MSEPIALPSREDQEDRWYQHECVLCAGPMPPSTAFSTRYCGPECRAAMTKLIRQHRNRQRASR